MHDASRRWGEAGLSLLSAVMRMVETVVKAEAMTHATVVSLLCT